ncbi:MAG: hypothetical protein AB1324_02950 [Candidatus Micrarchaeota archaeon]
MPPGDKPDGPKNALPVHPEFRTAVQMINSIRVLGKDMQPDETKTREQRQRQFDKIKHVLEDYEFCEVRGIVIRVR